MIETYFKSDDYKSLIRSLAAQSQSQQLNISLLNFNPFHFDGAKEIKNIEKLFYLEDFLNFIHLPYTKIEDPTLSFSSSDSDENSFLMLNNLFNQIDILLNMIFYFDAVDEENNRLSIYIDPISKLCYLQNIQRELKDIENGLENNPWNLPILEELNIPLDKKYISGLFCLKAIGDFCNLKKNIPDSDYLINIAIILSDCRQDILYHDILDYKASYDAKTRVDKRHKTINAKKELIIKEWFAQINSGISKNEFAKEAADKYSLAYSTVRHNYLQGIEESWATEEEYLSYLEHRDFVQDLAEDYFSKN